MLITGAVTLITWLDTLGTRSYMRKHGGEAPGQDAVGASLLEIRQLRCVVRRRLSCGFPISYVVDRILDRALSEQVKLIKIRHLRTVHQRLGQHSSYNFPE